MKDWDDIEKAAKEAERKRHLRAVLPDGSVPPPPSLNTLNLAELAQTTAEAVVFAIERIAPLGEVTLFTGPGSAGKSLLAQQITTAAAAGLKCLGLDVMQAPSLYVSCEDNAGQLHYRQERICEALGVSMASLAGKLHLASLRGELDNSLTEEDGKGHLKPSIAYQRLAETIRASGAKIVALDNVAHLFTGNENDRGEVTRFVNILNRLASQTGAAILLIGHPNKSGDNYSGSTAWLNSVRSQAWINRVFDAEGNETDSDVRQLSIGKANYAALGDAVLFRWHNWAFILEDQLPVDQRTEIAEVIKANGENAAFLRCLDIRNTQERPVSDSPASRTYAPKEFAAMAEAKGIKRARLEAAMDRLFRTGEIDIGLVCRTGRKDRFGLRRKCADLRADPAPSVAPTPRPPSADPAPTHTLISKDIIGAGPTAPAPSIESGWSPDAYFDDDLDWRDYRWEPDR